MAIFIILKEPVHISVAVFYNLTKLISSKEGSLVNKRDLQALYKRKQAQSNEPSSLLYFNPICTA